jgi:hypothetical protein
MAAMISSEARWLVSGRAAGAPGSASVQAEAARPAAAAPTDHRLRRQLGRKCASVLAGASVSLGLAAARMPIAAAQSGPSGAGVAVTGSAQPGVMA